MTQALTMPATAAHRPVFKSNRPGWIPAHITENWDTNPYAYQTEADLMPAGGPHGQLLTHIAEVLRVPLKQQGLMLLVDSFMLYRDVQGIKQRVGPDLLLMAAVSPPPSAYDLEQRPVPPVIIEITSPDSHRKDLKTNVPLYLGLGVEAYLVIDIITPAGRLRDPIDLYLWRPSASGPILQRPPAGDELALPQMNLRLSVAGQRLIFVNATTGAVLLDNEDWARWVDAERQRAEQERRRAEDADRRAEQVERRNARLLAQLQALGIVPDEIVPDEIVPDEIVPDEEV